MLVENRRRKPFLLRRSLADLGLAPNGRPSALYSGTGLLSPGGRRRWSAGGNCYVGRDREPLTAVRFRI